MWGWGERHEWMRFQSNDTCISRISEAKSSCFYSWNYEDRSPFALHIWIDYAIPHLPSLYFFLVSRLSKFAGFWLKEIHAGNFNGDQFGCLPSNLLPYRLWQETEPICFNRTSIGSFWMHFASPKCLCFLLNYWLSIRPRLSSRPPSVENSTSFAASQSKRYNLGID